MHLAATCSLKCCAVGPSSCVYASGADTRIANCDGDLPEFQLEKTLLASLSNKSFTRHLAATRRKAQKKSKLQPVEPVAVSAAKEAAAAAAAKELLAELEYEGHAVKLSKSRKKKQRAKEKKARKQQQTQEQSVPAALSGCRRSPEAGHTDSPRKPYEKSQQKTVSEENYEAAAQVLQAIIRGNDARSELAVLEEPQVAAAVLQAETGSQLESDKFKVDGLRKKIIEQKKTETETFIKAQTVEKVGNTSTLLAEPDTFSSQILPNTSQAFQPVAPEVNPENCAASCLVPQHSEEHPAAEVDNESHLRMLLEAAQRELQQAREQAELQAQQARHESDQALLQARQQSSLELQHALLQVDQLRSQNECAVCFEESRDAVLYPCKLAFCLSLETSRLLVVIRLVTSRLLVDRGWATGMHASCCYKCSATLHKCPNCRHPITGFERIYSP